MTQNLDTNSREEDLRLKELATNLNQVESLISDACGSADRLRESVTLIAVTKTYPATDVAKLATLGVINFGENRSNEGAEKSAQVKGAWHFQGQIQGNKIGSIAQWADVVHSLDRSDHARKFDRSRGEINQGKLSVFLQVSLDSDPARSGVAGDELFTLANSVVELAHLNLMGLMCVPPVTLEPDRAFADLAILHERFKASYPMAQSLSAGMSGDFSIAISHGATHVRIGSQILGPRALNP
jgi:hypothetical protein